jgi:uncharacterized protein (DUF4415 family)
MAIKQKKHEQLPSKCLPADWKRPSPGWEGRGPAPEISEDMLESRNVKEKISIWIDQDLLDAVRDTAKKSGEKYQPLINRVLRQIFLPSQARPPHTMDELAIQLRALWEAVEELKKKSED